MEYVIGQFDWQLHDFIEPASADVSFYRTVVNSFNGTNMVTILDIIQQFL
jgi:hypothetical protein